MKQFIFPLFIFASLFTSCQQSPNVQAHLDELEEEVQRKGVQMAALQKKIDELNFIEEKGSLVHMVFFKVKDDISTEDKAKLMWVLEGLDDIEEVKNFEVGNFEDLGDERALSDYDVVIQMEFLNAAEYKKYQEDERHIKAKGELKPFLAGPPASYDFVVE
ncbi:MAG: Dabb family protein [Chitinophagales bacterium]